MQLRSATKATPQTSDGARVARESPQLNQFLEVRRQLRYAIATSVSSKGSDNGKRQKRIWIDRYFAGREQRGKQSIAHDPDHEVLEGRGRRNSDRVRSD